MVPEEKTVIENIESMRDEIVEFLQDLVKMPSEVPPGKYKEISKFIESKMLEVGINTQRKKNNVLGEIGNELGPSLIFYAHLDTDAAHNGWTKDPYGGEIVDNKIYGRGACDDKSCIAAEIFAVKALLNSGFDFKGKLILTATINEEIGGILGADYIVNKGLVKGDACLIGDSICDYPVAYRAGTFQISFTIKGIRRHAQGWPDLPTPNRNKYSGINAIHKMLPIMNFLADLQEELKSKETKYPLSPDMPSKISSVNLTLMEGGVSVNSVPDKCVLHCIINTIPEQDMGELKSKILDFIEDLKNRDPELNITVQIPIYIEPEISNTNSDFAKIVTNVYKTVYNEEREFKIILPTTDATFFHQKGIETLLIGTIRGDNNIHSTDEFIYIEDLINVTKIYALTALNYLK
ncbi:MAG: M20/M25/M40 family metallo-hydrolase [Candidatus Lokiarchaeota archaeon]|nr:M20/M25/M40 family metallo-hydrolase [Candidatus Lokiarchaeota archaeon]